MQCVILAAGEGSRMRPLTTSRPKVMLPIVGKPILKHLIDNVKAIGITDIIVVLGYKASAIKEYFKNENLTYVVQKKQIGTGDALREVEPFIKDMFLMLNGDMIVEAADIDAFIKLQAPAMCVSTTTHPQDFGVVTIEDTKIASLEEKTPNPKSNIINAGAYLFTKDIFAKLRKISSSSRGEYELTDALMDYISEKSLSAYKLSNWIDIGYPWDLLSANEHMLNNAASSIEGSVEEHVFMKGIVKIGKNTVIKSGTYIEGPCIIGENCEVGPNAYIRPGTIIGNGCHIGHAVEIKNSVIFSNTKIPHYNYIGDSVIGEGCNFGAGTKIANLRHDKQPVKVGGVNTGRKKFGAVIGDDVLFGINCSINTGSSIGSGSRIAPGVIVSGKLENNTEVR